MPPIAAAATAFEVWGETTPAERQLALFRIADAMERAPRSSPTWSRRTPASRAPRLVDDEILLSVDQIRFFAGAARNLEGRARRRVHEGPHLLHPARADRRRSAR